jgi:hypothetical protein
MTVGELIAKLRMVDQSLPVILQNEGRIEFFEADIQVMVASRHGSLYLLNPNGDVTVLVIY